MIERKVVIYAPYDNGLVTFDLDLSDLLCDLVVGLEELGALRIRDRLKVFELGSPCC